VGVVRPGATLRVVPVPATRLVDTRTGTGTAQQRLGKSPLTLPVTGVAGVPADDVSAVLVQVSASRATATTGITVHPAGQVAPALVHLSTGPGRVVTNLVLVPVGTDGAVVVHNQTGATDVALDVVGYLPF
jgi:hypothetical protein